MKRIGFFLFLIFACILQPYTHLVDAQSTLTCHFGRGIVCTTVEGDPATVARRSRTICLHTGRRP
jgi:hypothetical protein